MLARFWPAIVVGIVFALVGPWLMVPRSEPAGEPFVYVPPDGFVENVGQSVGPVDMTGQAPKLTRPPEGEREWIAVAPSGVGRADRPASGGLSLPMVRLTLAHSATMGTVEPADLKRIADGMPAMLAAEGVTWKLVRTETRERADGARVGLIEGECTKGSIAYRRLMLAFPDDTGLSVVVAVYGDDDATRWQAPIEASIATARGVAKRRPAPPPWMRGAWGAGGLVLGAAAVAFFRRSRRANDS